MESHVLADVTNTYKQRSSTSSKPLNRQSFISRTMKSGACTYSTHWGTRLISCDCTESFFDIQIPLTDDPLCKICGHSLSQHASVSLTEHNSADLPRALAQGQFHSDLCRREETISTLWDELIRCKIMHARGTPSCGKTTLGRLLQAYVKRERPDIRVYRFSWPSPFPDKYNVLQYYELLDDILHTKHEEAWDGMQNTLLIVDEAQLSYTYTSFWNDLIKNMPGSGKGSLMVLLLSSYGSPSAIAVPPTPGSSPVVLHPDNRISIRPLPNTNPLIGLYFTRKEYDDVLRRFCQNFVSSGQPFLLSENASNYVWKFTNGHPSAVRLLLEYLANSAALRKFRVQREIVPLKEIETLLNNEEAFLNKLIDGSQTFSRSLPRRSALQENPVLSDTLRQVLASGSLSGDLEDNPGLTKCYKYGWLQAELDRNDKTIYYFPTHMHQMYAESLLQGNKEEFPITKHPTLRHLILATLRNFSKTSLLSAGQGLTTGATKIPLEAQYQNEMYRAVYHTLGQKIFLTSEWGTASKDGRVDFLLKQVKWGIECAREGTRLAEHIQRFLPGGRYYPWIEEKQMLDYILIDFRTSMPKISKGKKSPKYD